LISHEIRILCGLTGLTSDSRHKKELLRFMSLVRNKDLLIDLALQEGVACILYKSLMKSGLLGILSTSQREKLETLYYQTLRLNLRLINDLKGVLYHLHKKKIQVVLLQGIILLKQLYSDIGLRPLRDIDLWVLKKDYLDLIGVLRNEGYERDPLYPNTFKKGLTIFDLHTHILGADRIKARTLLLPKDQHSVFNDTPVIQFEGLEARCLGQYEQILYLSLHALKHNLDKLMWLIDIKSLLANWSESDWETLIIRAEELDQTKALSYILFLLMYLLDFQMPLKAHQFMDKTRFNLIETHLLMRRVRSNSLPLWAPLVLFSPEKGVRNRLIFILETLFPRPEILRQVFVKSPERKEWQLYCMRILQLLRMIKMSLKVRFGL